METSLILMILVAAIAAPMALAQEPPPPGEISRPSDDATSTELLDAGDAQFSDRRYEQALEFYKTAVERAEKEKKPGNQTEALAQVARAYLILDKKEEGEKWLEKARKAATKDEPKGWSRYLGVRGRFEWKSDKLDVAKKTFTEMYDFCNEQKLYDRAVDAAHMVALVATTDEKVEWAKKGIAAAEKGKFDGWLGPLWNNLGWTYKEQKKYPEMLDALLKAREYHYKGSNELSKLIADNAVAQAYRLNGKLKQARDLLTTTLATANKRYAADSKNAENAEWVGWCEVEMGDLLAAEGDKKAALEHKKTGRKYLVESGIEEWGKSDLEEVDAAIKALEEEK
ncbi:MAG: hypothetical protein IT462_18035 [Planctomycetes bacterium]|nr:hypothetical protein [Planctomycetota bacterium]